MLPICWALILATGLLCEVVATGPSDAAMASTRHADTVIAVAPDGLTGRTDLPAIAAYADGPAVPLPAKLAVSAVSVAGLGLYLCWRTRRFA